MKPQPTGLSPFPLSEEEMISKCVKSASWSRKHDSSCTTINALLAEARREFKYQYHKARGYRSIDTPMKAEHVSEMDALYLVIWPEIEKGVRNMCLEYDAEQKARKITLFTVESCVRSAMEGAGFKDFNMVCQRYRVKVSVFIPTGKYRVTFIVKYKDILAGHIDEYVADFTKFTELLSALPFDVNVRK